MSLSITIVQELGRIGATIPAKADGNAIDVRVNQVAWPDVAFSGSTERMRRSLTHREAGDFSTWSDQQIQDEMPSLYNFRFLPADSRGKFWEGWEEAFPSVDSTRLCPFASDDYFFYFLTENSNDKSDPLVFSVDHEETDIEPYDERGLTVSRLLSIITPIETNAE